MNWTARREKRIARLKRELERLTRRAKALPVDDLRRWSMSVRAGLIRLELQKHEAKL